MTSRVGSIEKRSSPACPAPRVAKRRTACYHARARQLEAQEIAMRKGAIARKTKETTIEVGLDLDGSGVADVSTGVGFFDHMLDQLARHSLIDLTIRAEGDRHIDDHHTVEDVGIAVGQALAKALGDKRGVTRSTCQAGRSSSSGPSFRPRGSARSTRSWCASSSRPSPAMRA
jgi:hypothetical protein